MNQWFYVSRWSVVCLGTVVCSLLLGEHLAAQSGIRESLERLDKNNDGVIERDEITPLARPYLERILRARRMSIDRPNDIDKIQEAARSYAAQQNGSRDSNVRPQGESNIKPFGTDRGQPLIPEFGLARVKFPYTQADLDFADRTMRSHDRNEDGYIDRAEAARNRWTHRNPFDDDLDGDNRLSRLEMAQRYARRRLLEGASGALRLKSWRTGSGVRSSKPTEQDRRGDSQWWRRGGSQTWLTASLMGRFDANRNGRLDFKEMEDLGISSSRIDADRDGEVTREELQAYMEALQEEVGGLIEGLPSWFYELDVNRDGQIEMSEFATEWTEQKLAEFALLDTNGDALLTETEVIRSKAMVGGSYENHDAEVLPPRKTIISEIEISEDYLIGDLNVQISITHSSTGHLDAYLTGPDGQRIELFTEIGGSGDNFDETLFDDQSRSPIAKARSPFKGTFRPESLDKRQPALSEFNGKNINGVWQLVVRGTRSDRFGMLHGWSLIVKPLDAMAGSPAAAPAEDGPQPRSRSENSRSGAERSGSERSETARSDTRRREEQETVMRQRVESLKQKYFANFDGMEPAEKTSRIEAFQKEYAKFKDNAEFKRGSESKDGYKDKGGLKDKDGNKNKDGFKEKKGFERKREFDNRESGEDKDSSRGEGRRRD
jgi:subtilisin-like proprotein convertase family protein/Ca2+-binding EF-hand superfamily protein